MNSDAISDDMITESVRAVALSDPGQLATPDEFYGTETWDAMLRDDAADGGMNAVAQFDLDWGFRSTPGQRADAVWTNRMSRDAGSVFYGLSEALNDAQVEANENGLGAVLARRSGNGGM